MSGVGGVGRVAVSYYGIYPDQLGVLDWIYVGTGLAWKVESRKKAGCCHGWNSLRLRFN